MSQRINVGLEPNTDIDPVRTALEAAGAESIQGPRLELPDVLTVTISSDRDLDEFIRMAQKLPGVRYAEPDSWQFTA